MGVGLGVLHTSHERDKSGLRRVQVGHSHSVLAVRDILGGVCSSAVRSMISDLGFGDDLRTGFVKGPIVDFGIVSFLGFFVAGEDRDDEAGCLGIVTELEVEVGFEDVAIKLEPANDPS